MYSWANRIKFFFHSNILILVKWNGAIRKQFLLFCFVFFKINLNQILCKNGMEFCRNHWTENHLLLLSFFVFCWFFCTKSTSTGMERDCAGTIGQKSRHRSRSDDNQLCQVCNSQIQCFIPKSSSKYPFFHNFRKLCTICASCIDFPENYVFFCKICVGVQDLHLPIMILHWKCWNFTHSDREG